MFNKVTMLLSLVLLTTGCVNVPESLRVDESTQLVSFAQVKDQAGQHQGELARWGGVIAKVENHADNTMLEVVHFSLKASTRPTPEDQTQGRFRIYSKGLLDPVIYKEGRSVTVLGKIAPSEQGSIGEHEYLYPVINASAVHLWKKAKPISDHIIHQPYWYTPALWYTPRPYYPYSPYPYLKQKPVINQAKKK